MKVRDYLPLQQGLRLGAGQQHLELFSGQRLSSTTTRIKTLHNKCPKTAGNQSETIFHYNKD